MMAASQIHSDEPHTCAMPRTELATPARSVNGPSAWLIATPNPTEKPAQIMPSPIRVTAWRVARLSVTPAARNSTCEVSIKVRGLNSDRANGVEKETAMLIIAIRAIAIE
jgi:hypothetical protein